MSHFNILGSYTMFESFKKDGMKYLVIESFRMEWSGKIKLD